MMNASASLSGGWQQHSLSLCQQDQLSPALMNQHSKPRSKSRSRGKSNIVLCQICQGYVLIYEGGMDVSVRCSDVYIVMYLMWQWKSRIFIFDAQVDRRFFPIFHFECR